MRRTPLGQSTTTNSPGNVFDKMVMGLRTAIVPLALYLGGAAAFNADFAWHEARQTDGDLAKMAGIVPLATAAPEPGLLQKRGTNTCGFIDGDASTLFPWCDDSLYCSGSPYFRVTRHLFVELMCTSYKPFFSPLLPCIFFFVSRTLTASFLSRVRLRS